MKTFKIFQPTYIKSFSSLGANLDSIKNTFYGSVSRARISKLTELQSKDAAEANLFKFYKTDSELFSTTIGPTLHPEHTRMLNLFEDRSLMIREPLTEIIQILHKFSTVKKSGKKIYSNVPKFLIHGLPGSGITTIYAMLAMYAKEQNGIIFNFYNSESWLERKKNVDYTVCNEYHMEQHKSNVNGDIFDFPERAQNWLKYFLEMNKDVMNKLGLKLKKQVDWSRKDKTIVGTPWVEIINFGIERIKYANDVIGILLREARLSSHEDECPFFLMIDGVNFLWCRSTILRDFAQKKLIDIDRLSIVNHLKRGLKADWSNGAVICTTNPRCSWPTDREQFDPGYLLTKPGWEHLDPFIPIEVKRMKNDEFESMLNYYAEHRWLTRPESYTLQGKNQLAFLSDYNMKELFRMVAEW